MLTLAHLHSDMSLADLALQNSVASSVLRRHRLDFCCGGQQSLAQACASKGLQPQALLDEIRLESSRSAMSLNLAASLIDATNSGIIDAILTAFHQPHREELQRLCEMAHKVESVHSAKASCPIGLYSTLSSLRDELEDHMNREESALFPLMRQPDFALSALPSIQQGIKELNEEHILAGAALEKIRTLTDDFHPPIDACRTWRALYLGLEAFEAALMEHVHIENHLLFPRYKHSSSSQNAHRS